MEQVEEVKKVEEVEEVQKRTRGRPKLLPEQRKPKQKTDPAYSRSYYLEHRKPDIKPRGRPKINNEKVYYKPKDPDYFKNYYLEITKPKNKLTIDETTI
jgi:hypothetical protein